MKLNIDNISKTYPNGVQALKNISMEIGNGIFGLLGPNGAGKSTLMRTIAALQEADSGTIMLGDVDVAKDKQRLREMLGYLPQEFGVYPKVSAIDLLEGQLQKLWDTHQTPVVNNPTSLLVSACLLQHLHRQA